MLELKNITKKYNDEIALNHVSCSFSSPSFVFIQGESGSGKSTLLNLIGFLEQQYDGDILINGKNYHDMSEKEKRNFIRLNIGFSFQDTILIPEFTVLENILSVIANPTKEDREKAIHLLKQFGLEGIEDFYPEELSGGEIQRVGICRMFMQEKPIYLCDEPTASLDSKNKKIVMEYLKELSKKSLVLFVSHETEFNEYADRILTVSKGKMIGDTRPTEDTKNMVLKEPTKESYTKFIFQNFKKDFRFRLGRIIFLIFLLFFTLSCLLFFSNLALTSKEEILVKSMYLNHVNCYKVDYSDTLQTEKGNYTLFNFSEDKYEKTTSFLKRNHISYYERYGLEFGNSFSAYIDGTLKKNTERLVMGMAGGYLEIDNDYLTDSGFDLVLGRLPQTTKEVCISKYTADSILERNQDLVNTYNDLLVDTYFEEYGVCGIIDTHTPSKMRENAFYDEKFILNEGIVNSVFVKKDFIKDNEHIRKDFLEKNELITKIDENTLFFQEIASIPKKGIVVPYKKITTDILGIPSIEEEVKKKLWDYANQNYSEYDNPINHPISEYYEYLIRASKDENRYNPERTYNYFEKQVYKEHLQNRTEEIKYKAVFSLGDEIIKKEFIVVGVNFDGNYMLSEEDIEEILCLGSDLNPKSIDIVLSGNMHKDKKIMRYFFKDMYTINTLESIQYENIKYNIILMKSLGTGLAAIVLIMVLFLMLHYFMDLIQFKTTQIGIYKAMGYPKSAILGSFYLQSGFIVWISFVCSAIAYVIIQSVIRFYLYHVKQLSVVFLIAHVYSFIIVFFVLIFFIFLFLQLGTRKKFLNINPLYVIRRN